MDKHELFHRLGDSWAAIKHDSVTEAEEDAIYGLLWEGKISARCKLTVSDPRDGQTVSAIAQLRGKYEGDDLAGDVLRELNRLDGRGILPGQWRDNQGKTNRWLSIGIDFLAIRKTSFDSDFSLLLESLEPAAIAVSEDTTTWPNLTKAANDRDISKGTVSRWVSAGLVNARKVGQELRIDCNSLDKYLEENPSDQRGRK